MHASVFLINWLFCIFTYKTLCDSLLFYISLTKNQIYPGQSFYIMTILWYNRQKNYQIFALWPTAPLSFPAYSQFLFYFYIIYVDFIPPDIDIYDHIRYYYDNIKS